MKTSSKKKKKKKLAKKPEIQTGDLTFSKEERKKRKQILKKANQTLVEIKRGRGRPRLNYTLQEATAIAREEGIQSVTQYALWWTFNRPVRMPKNPDRAYKNQWISWNHFLGNDNKFAGVQKKWRTYAESRAYVQTLGLKSVIEWRAFVKTNKLPEDIPRHPHIVYREDWLSWKNFLGYDLVDKQMAIEQVKPVIYIAKNTSYGVSGVYIINVISGGKPALVDHLTKLNMPLVAAYYMTPEFDHRPFFASLNNYWGGKKDDYLVSNIFEIMEKLSAILDKVT